MNELQIPYLFEVDKECHHTKRVAPPIKIPLDVFDLGNICTDSNFHIEVIRDNFYLRSKTQSLFCESLTPKLIYIKNTTEGSKDTGASIIAYTCGKFTLGLNIWLKKIFFLELFEISKDPNNLPDTLRLLYVKSGSKNLDLQSSIYQYQWHTKIIESRKYFEYSSKIYQDVIDFEIRHQTPLLNHNRINPEFSEYFEGNSSLMSDDEYENLNGRKR